MTILAVGTAAQVSTAQAALNSDPAHMARAIGLGGTRQICEPAGTIVNVPAWSLVMREVFGPPYTLVEDNEICADGKDNNCDGFIDEVPCVAKGQTAATGCGDGFTNMSSGETCDDGNIDDSDVCTSMCLIASCGDGAHYTGPATTFNSVSIATEECDDGDGNDNNDCTNNCTSAVCGDGSTHNQGSGIEECDDGNSDNSDVCLDTCVEATCGDGKHYTGLTTTLASGTVVNAEACDDGDGNDNNNCTNSCTVAVCGDGSLWDQGTGNETCDDGDLDNGDGCDSNCQTEVCGNGVVQTHLNEECDPGTTGEFVLCSSSCKNQIGVEFTADEPGVGPVGTARLRQRQTSGTMTDRGFTDSSGVRRVKFRSSTTSPPVTRGWTMHFNKPGYATAIFKHEAEVTPGEYTRVAIPMVRSELMTQVTGGPIETITGNTSGVSLELDSGSTSLTLGGIASTTLVSLEQVNSNLGAVPGNMVDDTTITVPAAVSAGMMYFGFRDGSDNQIPIPSGDTVKICIPVSDGGADPAGGEKVYFQRDISGVADDGDWQLLAGPGCAVGTTTIPGGGATVDCCEVEVPDSGWWKFER